MKSLTKLSLTAGMIIMASQAIAREPLPVEVNGRSWANAAERLPVYQLPAPMVTTAVPVQPAVETVLGRASVIPVSSGEVVSNRVITAGSGRPAVEVVLGRGGAIPALANEVVRAARYQ